MRKTAGHDVFEQEVGTRLVRWGLGPNPSHDCVITAHGMQRTLNKTFAVPPNTNLIFYGPEGASLTDSGRGVEDVVEGKIQAYAALGPGAICSDYSLIKYQGYHQGPVAAMVGKAAEPFAGDSTETYHDIGSLFHTNNMLLKADPDDRADQNAPEPMAIIDVITVRYRPGRLPTNLSDAIASLRGAGINYRQIHCCFCRSRKRDLLWGPSYTPKPK